jgi:uncharacterized membrane protein
MSTLPASNDSSSKEPTPNLLPDEIKKALDKAPIPERQRQEIAVSIASYFQGPLPPPSLLRQYNDIVPNGAERIFKRFESQGEHRQFLERTAVTTQLRQSGRGQWFGLIIALFGLALSGFMAYLGFEIFASTLATTTIIGLVAIFVKGKQVQRQDLENKKKRK